jgi:chromosome segregation ATPase
MLLGKKIKEDNQANWALILDRPKDEFSKSRAVNVMVEAFSLAPEEARELVESTPIVLLDQLTLTSAQQIKERLDARKVYSSLTNDESGKRKCFRVVWPETPNLAALLGGPTPVEDELKSSDIPDLNTVAYQTEPFRLSQEMANNTVMPAAPTQVFPGSGSSEQTNAWLDEQKQLKQVILDLQHENESLRRQLDKSEAEKKDQDRKSLSELNNKVQMEKTQFEQAAKQAQAESSLLRGRVAELERKLETELRAAQNSKQQTVNSESIELRRELERLQAEHARGQEMVRAAQSEAQQFKAEWSRTQKVLSEARSECEDLKHMLNQAQATGVQLKEELERTKQEAEERFHQIGTEADEWKRKANELSATLANTTKENEYLRAHRSEEIESLRARNQQLGNQLEQAQRQNRDFVSQLEQQELVQRRLKVASELQDQEARLRELSQKEQALQDEIRLRNDELRSVTQDEAKIEEEIVKIKQAQKYIMEQAKMKEKKNFSRPKIASPDEIPDQNENSDIPANS